MTDELHSHHPNVGGGPVRAAVFGISDGLVSNVSLVLGVAGASSTASVVRLAGLAGLIAGACSMAAGEYVSMKAQTELLEHELKREQHELAHRPEFERRELISIYEARGVSHDTAVLVTDELMSSPEQALETHAREEMGVDPNNLGSPIGAAVSSFIAFCIGAIVPLAPWFFGSGTAAVLASIMLTVVSAIIIGATLANFSGRSPIRGALRQLVLTSAAAAVTYAIGSLLGT